MAYQAHEDAHFVVLVSELQLDADVLHCPGQGHFSNECSIMCSVHYFAFSTKALTNHLQGTCNPNPSPSPKVMVRAIVLPTGRPRAGIHRNLIECQSSSDIDSCPGGRY